jgi:Putative zincin peptidase
MSPSSEPRLLSRFLRRPERQRLEAGMAEGRLVPLAQFDILAPEGLPELARWSLLLLLTSLLFFILLDVAAWLAWRRMSAVSPFQMSWLLVIGLIIANVAAYFVVLPLHEAVHAAAILAQGGSPRFGMRLPLALYCTAPDQLFTQRGYLVVAGAPLVVITAMGIVVTIVAPPVAAFLILGLAGNVSGAVGDLATMRRVRRLPSAAVLADTETGYIAYVVA